MSKANFNEISPEKRRELIEQAKAAYPEFVAKFRVE